jgi:hypothetical protein
MQYIALALQAVIAVFSCALILVIKRVMKVGKLNTALTKEAEVFFG